MLSLRIDGIPAQSFGYGKVGDLEVAHLWSGKGGGLHYVKFSLALPRRYTHPALREGALVDISRGGYSLGTAVLSDVDREGWTFTADGLFRRAEHFNAEGTLSPADVVEAANATRGLGWNGVGNLPATVLPTDGNVTYSTVADVLNAYCALNNKRWGLGFDGTPYIADDPTEPSFALRPGTPTMPTADDDYVSRVTVRYVSAVTGTPPEPSAWSTAVATSTDTPHGAREKAEDVTSMGLLAPTDAQAYADAYLAANAARRGFTAGIEVARGQATTLGDTALDSWTAGLFMCGKRVLQHNVLETDGRAAYGQTRQWVVGSTVYKSDRSLTLMPVEVLPRTVAQVVASQATTDLRQLAGIVNP